MSLKQHLMSLASVRYTICKIYYNQQEKNEGPRLERHRSFFDIGDDTNAKKTADTV